MRNKKVVRLTESQLHNIIAESVEKILKEMTPDQYNTAIQTHPKLMNNVDPRTFRRRMGGINAQGKKRNDNIALMKKAALDGYNKKLNRGNYKHEYDDGSTYEFSKQMDDDFVFTNTIRQTDPEGVESHKSSVIYDPNKDKVYASEYWKDKPKFSGRSVDNFSDYTNFVAGQQNANLYKELFNAKEFAKDEGDYLPGKGWVDNYEDRMEYDKWKKQQKNI